MVTKTKKQQAIFLVFTTILVYLAYKHLLPLVLPFLFAYWFSLCLEPMIEFLSKHFKLPKCIGTSISIILCLSVVGISLFYLLRVLILQLDALLKNYPIYQQLFFTTLDDICGFCDDYFKLKDGVSYQFITANMTHMENTMRQDLIPQLTEQAIVIIKKTASFFGCLFIIILSTMMILKDKPSLYQNYKKNIFYNDIHAIAGKLSQFFLAYFRMQAIITSIIAVGCSVCFFLVKSEYAILLGVFVAIFDAFPILGSGLVFVPLAIFEVVSGNFYATALYLTTYAFCQITRQLLEPRLLGNRIGIPPIFTIMSIIIGLKLYGIIGVLLGPISYVTIKTILEEYQANPNT